MRSRRALALLAALPLVGADARLEVHPQRALCDEPLSVRASRLVGERTVTLRATATDGHGIRWESHATFAPDATGRVDTARQAPLSGTWTGVDPRALLWSMRPDGEVASFSTDGVGHSFVELRLEADGRVLARTAVERLYPWAQDDLRAEPVRADGLIGTFWHATGARSLPTVLMLGGSGGSPQPERASLLAARGFAVLDLLYFGTDPLPSELVRVPLEYFDRALDWLEAHPAADTNRLGVFGASKGAELALLLATRQPSLRAVVAYVPSSVVWAGISFRTFWPDSSWTQAGEPLPFVPFEITTGALWRTFQLVLGRPARVRPTYERAFANTDAVERAAIPVERIQGAVLLASGSDDGLWPSMEMADQIVARLRAHDFPHPYHHLAFDGAGHALGVPGFPRPDVTRRLDPGGTAQADARAGAIAWAATRELFQRHLGVTSLP